MNNEWKGPVAARLTQAGAGTESGWGLMSGMAAAEGFKVAVNAEQWDM